MCGLCSCSLGNNSIGDAGATAIGVGLVHVPQLQRLKYVVCPAVCVALVCACMGTQGDGMCMRWRCCVCGSCSCSLYYNRIGDAGAAAIGAGLVHLPQLWTLRYVVGPALVCVSAVYACTGTQGDGPRLTSSCCVCGLCSCSLGDNGIGDAGAAAIGAGLVHVPQLQRL